MKPPAPSVDLGYPTEPHGKVPAFHSIEEEATFWDTHDTTEFNDEWRPVEVRIGGELAETLTLRLERADRDALAREARKRGVGPSTLAKIWVRQHLREEADAEVS